ncbi:unnamed protein product, partial [Polarella glacialis]
VAARAAASSSGARSGDRELECWAYFATQREWCDHVLLYSDGTYKRAHLGGGGTWRLYVPDGGSALLLELDGLGKEGPLVFVSPDGGTDLFEAGTSELRHVSGPAAPLGVDQGAAAKPRRGLLFSSVGSQCLPVVRDYWLRQPEAVSFDVALLHYGEEGSAAHQSLLELSGMHPFMEVHQRKDMKWPNFRHWCDLQGGLATIASRYDYVWVVDDDVRLPTEGVNRMFEILRSRDELQFACPAFDASSEGVWRYFDGHDPRYQLRYTDFVECTAPVLRSSMLLDPMFQKCLRATQTGCFIDFCFHPVSGARRDSVAVLDAVPCHHPPRGADAPSQMREVLAWEDHKQDEVFFAAQGVPKDWFWYRQPKVLGSIPAGSPR